MSQTEAKPRPAMYRPGRQRAWNRFLLVALALHVPLFVYPVLRLGTWLDAPLSVTLALLVPLAGSQLYVRMYLRGRSDLVAIWIRRAADFWLGLSPILLMTLLVFEALVAAGWVSSYSAAVSTLAITALLGVVGFAVASSPYVKTIELASKHIDREVRFAQITDVHIGSRSKQFLEQIMSRVNRLDPDFLCITGDFIDQTGVAESDLVSLRSAIYPIYFSIGNHERYEDLDDILARLARLGVRVLRSDTIDFRDDVRVIGIDDMDDPGQVGKELAKLDAGSEKFVVLLYHRPHGLEDAAEHGVDLMLSGHTHNGQIFPFNLIVRQVFDRVVGLFEHGDTRLYVSQGTGTWGPVLRFGTRAEITEFVVRPVSDMNKQGET